MDADILIRMPLQKLLCNRDELLDFLHRRRHLAHSRHLPILYPRSLERLRVVRRRVPGNVNDEADCWVFQGKSRGRVFGVGLAHDLAGAEAGVAYSLGDGGGIAPFLDVFKAPVGVQNKDDPFMSVKMTR